MNRIQVKRAYFFVSGTYNDMSLRPFQPHFQNESGIVDHFLNSTSGAQTITPESVAPIAGEFLRPSTQALGVAQIANNWQAERLRFMMHITIEVPDTSGSVQYQHKIVQGYTSHVGVDQNGNVDPSMTLHFNGVMSYRESHIQTPHGMTVRPSWTDKPEQILTGTPKVNPGMPNQTTRLMRPRDVFDNMAAINVSHLGGQDAISGHYGHPQQFGNQQFSGQMDDLCTPFITSPTVKSSRDHTRPSHFVSSIFDAWREASREEEADDTFGVGDPNVQHNTYTIAQNKLRAKGSFDGDVFFSKLNIETQFAEGGYVTYGELAQVAPEIDNPQVSTILFRRDVVRQQQKFQGDATEGMFPDVPSAGQGEYWGGENLETIWATILTNSIPALMVDNYLTYAAFHITNQTVDGQPIVTPLGTNSIIGGDSNALYNFTRQFLTRIETEVVRSLSRDNLIDYNVTMKIDVAGDTFIRLSLAGKPEVMYSTPSFADSTFSPILAPNAQFVGQMGNQFHQFIGAVGDRLEGRSHYNQQTHYPNNFGPNNGFV